MLRHRLEELTKELGGVDELGRFEREKLVVRGTVSELEVVDEPAEYMAYCCAVRGTGSRRYQANC